MQRKVSTSTAGVSRKNDLITHCLRGYPEGLTPKLISAKTGLNINTVKSALPKIPSVKKVLRGLYKVLEEGDGTFPAGGDLLSWNFHNLVLTARCSSVIGVDGVFDCGLVKCVLTVVGDKATFRVSSDTPLNVSSIGVVARLFADNVGVLVSDVMVSTVEFNKDYNNLRLDGVNSVSVDSLVEQFKLYQKTGGLRLEHKTKVPLSVDSIVDMLANRPDSLEVQVKLNEQRDALKALISATRNNTDMILKLADKLGKVN